MTLYELQPHLTFEQNYREISHAQIQLAINSLTGRKDMEKGIYAARKCMKRLRGLLRLFEDVTDIHERRALNAHYRDIARMLSDLRDAWVRVELLDALPEEARANPAVPMLREAFVTEYNRMREEFLQPGRYEEVVRRLKAAHEMVDAMVFDDLSVYLTPFSALEHPLERMRRGTRNARGQLERGKVDFEFGAHEWRKRIKRMWYGLTLARPIAPHLLDEPIAFYDEMGVLLGDVNDRNVLYATILERYSVSDPRGTTISLPLLRVMPSPTPQPVPPQDEALAQLQQFLRDDALRLYGQALQKDIVHERDEKFGSFMKIVGIEFARWTQAQETVRSDE